VVSTITLATTFSFAWPATEPPLSPRAHWGRGKDREREREGRACPGGVRSLLMPRATEHSGRAANLFAAFPFRPCAVSFAGASSEPTTDHEITTTNRELATRVNQLPAPPRNFITRFTYTTQQPQANPHVEGRDCLSLIPATGTTCGSIEILLGSPWLICEVARPPRCLGESVWSMGPLRAEIPGLGRHI